jgi:hypothetical protein
VPADVVLTLGLGDVGEGELRELTGALVDVADDELSVGIRQQRGFDPTVEHVIHVVLPWAAGYTAGKAVDAILAWARSSWRARKERTAGQETISRPIVLKIFGPRGEVLRQVKLDEPDGEPQAYTGGLTRRRAGETGGTPRGLRYTGPIWIAGPRAGGYQTIGTSPRAVIYPLRRFGEQDLERLRVELEEAGIQGSVAEKSPPSPFPKPDPGIPIDSILVVTVNVPFVEDRTLAAIGRWLDSRRFAPAGDGFPAVTIARPDGTPIRHLMTGEPE